MSDGAGEVVEVGPGVERFKVGDPVTGCFYTIHAFASPGVGSVNTYWIETANAVVVTDGQRQLSQARLAVEAIRTLGKPITAIFVTHEHPDHVGGLGVCKDEAGDAPISSSMPLPESDNCKVRVSIHPIEC